MGYILNPLKENGINCKEKKQKNKMTFNTIEIAENDFKSSGNKGNKSAWNSDFIADVENAFTENQGKIIGFSISEGLTNYIGDSKNPSKALNVLLRSFLDNPNKKVKISKAEDLIKVDLR